MKINKEYYDYHQYMQYMGNSFGENIVSTRLAEFMFAEEMWHEDTYGGNKPFCFKDTQWVSKIDWATYLGEEDTSEEQPCECGHCENCNQTGQYEL